MHIWKPYGPPVRFAGAPRDKHGNPISGGKQTMQEEQKPVKDITPEQLLDYNAHVDSLRGGSSRRSRPWRSARSTTRVLVNTWLDKNLLLLAAANQTLQAIHGAPRR